MINRKKIQNLLIFILLLICICFFIKLYVYDNDDHIGSYNLTPFKGMALIKMHLLKALRFSRSQIVKNEIIKALNIISKEVDQEISDIKYRRIQKFEENGELHDVCLEEFRGVIDHPLYNLGQIEIECNKKPFENVLTFVVMVDNCNEMFEIINGIVNLYNKSQILIGSLNNEKCTEANFPNIKMIRGKDYVNTLLSIISEVNTEYILFAPNIYHFDNQSRIERLVQMISYTEIDVAAGGVRLEDGKFSTGCYQMAMKMYTLKLVEGYDMSFNSCLYCDYSPAPFVTRKSFFMKQLKLHKKSKNNIFLLEFYTDLFISNRGQIFVCPDVMFHVKPYELSNNKRENWFSFVSKFELNRLLLPTGGDINFTCSESKMSCYKEKGLMVPLCCLKELSDSLKFMNNLLKIQNVTFEVLEGTVMGGIKYNNMLYWERDADTNFRVHKIDKLEEVINKIKTQGYSMALSYECPYKRDHEKCRHAGWHGSIYYAFRTQNWRTEMYGVTYILSDFRGKLKNPTKIKIDGEWYITYTNPALYGRNIYGGDIFQHIEHNSALGISHKEYSKLYHGYFASCSRPGFHGCLDNFVGEGNLQFLNLHV